MTTTELSLVPDRTTPLVDGRARSAGRIALVAVQLAAVLFAIRIFELESRTFFDVMLLACVGFVIHASLPLAWRLPFFALLSLGSLVVALGPLDAFFLVALGLVLVGICHLPLGVRARILLLLASGGVFALLRTGRVETPWSLAVWPVLGSMFMFRIALYLYALRYEAKRPTLAQALAYFFMLPNVCFPLYPVVDYATFVRTHYDREAAAIYERGVQWIVRGLVHLVLYRFVYLYLAGDPVEVATLGQLVQFLLATYLLYLRVSGQFHVIAGVLHLFGFRLPETHHLYFLASGFTDFWRRINIYWKDFMMKLVYYPSFFRLRRFGGNAALVGATAIVFFATWLLHSYQWFWLRGGFPLLAQDALFWAVLGGLVVYGSLREMKAPRKRRLGRGPGWSLSLALRTVSTFVALCVLWSLWSADSLSGWFSLWIVAGNVAPGDLWLLAALLGFGLLIGGRDWSAREAQATEELAWFRRPALQSAAYLLALAAAGSTELYARQQPELAATVASLQRSTLNARDAALQHKGYYENLDNESRMSVQLWEEQSRKPAHWVGLSATAAYRQRGDFLRYDLAPGAHITFLDRPFTTNRWGMRDGDTPLEKPANVYRIAVLGPSHVMGSGVGDGETFVDLLEQRLNLGGAAAGGTRYEVLNFGVAGYSLLQQLAMLEQRALAFEPDALLLVDSPRAREPLVGHLLGVLTAGVAVPYPDLARLLHEAGVASLAEPGAPIPFERARTLLARVGVRSRIPWPEAERRLWLASDRLMEWSFEQLGRAGRARGARPMFVALNNVVDAPSNGDVVGAARAAGLPVIDLYGLWQGRNQSELRIASGDNHPNAAGHRLIAEELLAQIEARRAELGIEHEPGGGLAAPARADLRRVATRHGPEAAP